MVQLEKRIKAFVKLGDFLRNINTLNPEQDNRSLRKLANESYMFNPWFTPDNVCTSIGNIGESLTEQSLNRWVEMYIHKLIQKRQSRRVGVVMAGNIPLVGFHDFLCVLFSGNKIIARLSSDDNKLLPAIASKLIEIEPGLLIKFYLVKESLKISMPLSPPVAIIPHVILSTISGMSHTLSEGIGMVSQY